MRRWNLSIGVVVRPTADHIFSLLLIPIQKASRAITKQLKETKPTLSAEEFKKTHKDLLRKRFPLLDRQLVSWEIENGIWHEWKKKPKP
jgi:hypothetical protein